MLKLIKYLKPFAAAVCAIVVLLLVQSFCDLTLPDYTSNIVNVGIQQGGIDSAVPKAIRKSELDKLILFMDETEKVKTIENYSLIDKSNLSKTEYEKYLKDYPKLADEPIYKLNTDSKDVKEALNTIIGKSILIMSGIEKNGLSSKIQSIPASTITQRAAAYIQSEYKVIGINTYKLQSKFILYSGGKMLLIALISMAASMTVCYLASYVAGSMGRSLRKSVFRKVVGFSNSEFDKFSTASLITRSTNDIQQIQTLMVMLLRIVVYAPILGIGGIIKVYRSDSSMWWIIAISVIVTISLLAGLFSIVIPKFKSVQKLVDKLNLVTREILTGMSVIRAFGTQKHEEKKFDNANGELTKTNLFVSRVMTVTMPLMTLIMNATTLLVVWVGGHKVDNGVMQVGNMMAFIQYAMQIIMSFYIISMVSMMLPRASVAAGRIDEILETDFTIKDAKNTEHFAANFKGNIEFENVSFRYPGAEEDALSNISFSANPGQTTAFIGSTGSGKSTLINLIPRFYDVTSGRILIDGMDTRAVSQHELRENIGYVPQKGVLFSGTIESNLSFGCKNATECDLEKSAAIAQASEFIKEKPEGFKAQISQGGKNISGGQKQRLSIARALTKNPKIFIFDDSFSALDFRTDALLRKALKEETENSTVLIVAQRISTIMNADQIVVLNEGKIEGIGTHEELIKSCEVYREIALSQLSKEELA
jgi:ATP-binding cassette subfamily B protein